MDKYLKWLNTTYPSGRFILNNNKVLITFHKVAYSSRATEKQLSYLSKFVDTTKCNQYLEYISKYLVSGIILLHKAYPQLRLQLQFNNK